MGALLYLQGGGMPPHLGPGALVFGRDWHGGLNAPHLDAEWLAQAFPVQLAAVDEWLDDAEGAVGFGWGSWLLLCSMITRAELGQSLSPCLLLSCFMGRGRYTGQETDGHVLPRTEEVARALQTGCLADAEIRFVHGRRDEMAPLAELGGLNTQAFSLRVADACHLLRGPGEALLSEELERLQNRLAQLQRHSRS
jgi:hypothetical protein